MRRFGTEISGNRRPGGELSSEARAAIIYAHECGVSPTKMAAEFNVARSTIYSTIKRFREHQTLKSLHCFQVLLKSIGTLLSNTPVYSHAVSLGSALVS